MNKKKFIVASLASVAVLGASLLATQPSVVKADRVVDPSIKRVGDDTPTMIPDLFGPQPEPAPAKEPAPAPAKEPAKPAPAKEPAKPAPAKEPAKEPAKPAPAKEPAKAPGKKSDVKAPAKGSATASDKKSDVAASGKKSAAKAEGMKELPKTGATENAALTSVGFLGLVLGALPFVKRNN